VRALTAGVIVRATIAARAQAPTPPPPQFLLMIRTLLADRFSLVMHNETARVPHLQAGDGA